MVVGRGVVLLVLVVELLMVVAVVVVGRLVVGRLVVGRLVVIMGAFLDTSESFLGTKKERKIIVV